MVIKEMKDLKTMNIRSTSRSHLELSCAFFDKSVISTKLTFIQCFVWADVCPVSMRLR